MPWVSQKQRLQQEAVPMLAGSLTARSSWPTRPPTNVESAARKLLGLSALLLTGLLLLFPLLMLVLNHAPP